MASQRDVPRRAHSDPRVRQALHHTSAADNPSGRDQELAPWRTKQSAIHVEVNESANAEISFRARTDVLPANPA